MQTPQGQYLVFTALDGETINSSPACLQEILPALELLRSRNIPLIAASMESVHEVIPLIQAFDLPDPFIVENGAAIYVPDGSLNVDFKCDKKIQNYRVIELATPRQEIRRKLDLVRRQGKFDVEELSPQTSGHASDKRAAHRDPASSAPPREYSEIVAFRGENGDLQRFQTEIEQQQMRLVRRDNHLLIFGDHDEGSAVRLLLQLYREANPDLPVISVGLSDNSLGSALLHAVDIPILVRREDGRFDDGVGRYGLKFTRNPGPVGWSQAVIAVITEDAEA